MAKSTTAQLTQLRALMAERNVHVYIVPSEDAHFSENVAACDARRAFLTGFNGSAGLAAVTADEAVLSTDGRYFNQATQQMDSNWTLLRDGVEGVPTWKEWVAEKSQGGKTVGVDPRLLSSSAAEELSELIAAAGGADLLAVDENLVDLVWGSERPSPPGKPIKELVAQFSGETAASKIEKLQKELAKKKSPGFFVTLIDEVAWLFNLRGDDVPYNPVFFSYAAVTPTEAILYVEDAQLTPETKSYLSNSNITVKAYSAFLEDARQFNAKVADERKAAEAGARPGKFLISTLASWALKTILGGNAFVESIRSPISDAKAIKNETELEGMRQCHIRDGASLSKYFAWLEDQLLVKKATVDEVQGADKLKEFRSNNEHFAGLSFATISCAGPNAAIMHYDPVRGNCSNIDPEKIYLCDSGAQYLDGTTDTTRTLHFGTPTPEEKKVYTLVLKGHIALDRAIFPKGTTGFALDILARQFIWNTGRDFRHGTGHGVGSYLNIHEGPIGIAPRLPYAKIPLAPGNVLSNEPGYYEDGKFGLRIENMMMVREVETETRFGDVPYYGFEHVTFVPYCRNLIDTSLLTVEEKEYLNAYNAEVVEKTGKFFEGDDLTKAWLERETATY